MDQETDREEDRHPRQIDDRDRSRAGEEGADLVEVAHRLMRFGRAAARLASRMHRVMHA